MKNQEKKGEAMRATFIKRGEKKRKKKGGKGGESSCCTPYQSRKWGGESGKGGGKGRGEFLASHVSSLTRLTAMNGKSKKKRRKNKEKRGREKGKKGGYEKRWGYTPQAPGDEKVSGGGTRGGGEGEKGPPPCLWGGGGPFRNGRVEKKKKEKRKKQRGRLFAKIPLLLLWPPVRGEKKGRELFLKKTKKGKKGERGGRKGTVVCAPESPFEPRLGGGEKKL